MVIFCSIQLWSNNVALTWPGVRYHGVDEVYNSGYLRKVSFQLDTKNNEKFIRK